MPHARVALSVQAVADDGRTNFSACFKEMSAMVFLRRLWKIPKLVKSS
jgi:hypothetical protein